MSKNQKKSEKLLRKIAKKKVKIKKLLGKGTDRSKRKAEKLKEEIRKMIKMALKDGKLQVAKPEDNMNTAMGQPQPAQQPVQQGGEDPFDTLAQTAPVPPPEMQQPTMPQQPVIPQTPQQQEIIQQQLQQQEMEQMRLQQFQESVPPQQTIQTQVVPPQQTVQRPTVPPQVIAEQGPAKVIINMENGVTLPVDVPSVELDQFLEKLSEAIDNQSSLQIGTRVINGRFITDYQF